MNVRGIAFVFGISVIGCGTAQPTRTEDPEASTKLKAAEQRAAEEQAKRKAAEKTNKDMELIRHGVWHFFPTPHSVEFLAEGPFPNSILLQFGLDGNVTIGFGGEVLATYRFTPTDSPSRVEFSRGGKTWRGVYEIDPSEFLICLPISPDGPVPTSMPKSDGKVPSGQILLKLIHPPGPPRPPKK